jgi:exoribonuclease-2
MDLLTLDISGTVLERLAPAQAQADEESLLAQDEDEVAGPITIALDVNDSGAAE